ncbi:MAG: class II aldolase/adducin family protein [Candidatus Edwardsbacteria bacterium]|nr:class II aldolase/adducin family protein [Candidatus Edwardsbacteria bacterium]
MRAESEYRRDIIEVCKRIYQKGYVASNDGNVTIKISDDEILATPTGMSKGDLSPDQLIKVNMKGEIISGFLKPSSELKLHIRAYEKRPDVGSVVHAHPPISTGFAVAGIALEQMAMPEVIATLGCIPLAPYGTPSTDELASTIDKFVGRCNAILLSNHGVVAVGSDVYSAYYTLERVEHTAHIIWVARTLGGEKALSKENIDKLMGLRKSMGVCATCPVLKAGRDNENQQSQLNDAPSDNSEIIKLQELVDLVTRVTAEVIKGR